MQKKMSRGYTFRRTYHTQAKNHPENKLNSCCKRKIICFYSNSTHRKFFTHYIDNCFNYVVSRLGE